MKEKTKEKGELKKMKSRNGITLIALVVTIIVLLILAGITINAVLSEGGIFNTALRTKNIQTDATVIEKIKLEHVNYEIEKITEGKEESFLNYLKGKGYANASGVINVETLLGQGTSIGKGTDGTDIYKIEDTEQGYGINYYGQNGEKKELTIIRTSKKESEGENNINWAQILQDANANPEKYRHPDQDSSIKDIGIGTDGSPVNLYLWLYDDALEDDGICLGAAVGRMFWIHGV